MYEVLRKHIQDFGFNHSEISRRATNLNQATAYRVVEGETQNPSISSITSIIEAISLTDADAGVLYRKVGYSSAKPRLLSIHESQLEFSNARMQAQSYLDQGLIKEAAHRVMAMFDLASTDDELCQAYEQAGVVYMGLGRWEEAQVNFESADAALQVNINDPNTDSALVNRKHTLMTNIGSLMVKRGNCSWGLLFGREVAFHPRVCELNRGWAQMVIGEAELKLNHPQGAAISFNRAVDIFRAELERINAAASLDGRMHCRQLIQAEGNYRWAKVHALKSAVLLGDQQAQQRLRELEIELLSLDPEASAMAGFFVAEQMPQGPHRKRKLLELKKRAKKNQLGEILQRIAALCCVLLVISVLTKQDRVPESKVNAVGQQSSLWERPVFKRGNTG